MSINIECPIGIINNTLENCKECEYLDECIGSLPETNEKPTIPFEEYKFSNQILVIETTNNSEAFIYIENDWVPLTIGLKG